MLHARRSRSRRTAAKGWLGLVLGAGLLLLLFVTAVPALAHGPLDETISKATRGLAESPGDADRWLRRAELHRLHGDYDAADADLRRAETLAPTRPEVDFGRARVLLARERFEAAEQALARFLDRVPTDVAAWTLRGEAQLALNRGREATESFAAALALRPNAGLYLAHAKTLSRIGDRDAALASLDEGMGILGPVPSLAEFAIELEVARHRFDRALGRLERLHAGSKRRDDWLMKRAQLLELAGRRTEARRSFGRVLTAVAELPTSRRHTPAARRTESLAREGLARLSGGGE